jgi:mannose-6-phosphate isomerase-like protein (cupin superfamily)
MGYEVVDSRAVEPVEGRPCELRRLTDAGTLSNLAVNRYRAEPGEQLPLKYHYHDAQEEAFYVLSGTLAVETPDGTHTVGSGSLFTATPGSPHRAFNPADADGPVEVLAVGAPTGEGGVHEYEPGRDGAEGDADGGA